MTAPTYIVIDVTTQLVGVVPLSHLPISNSSDAGLVKPDGVSTLVNPTTGVIKTAGISATVAIAKLTALGTDGSLTFVNGVLTAKVDPT